MGLEKLDLAARAAGYAMVNPDDTVTMPRQGMSADAEPESGWDAAPARDAATPSSSLSWIAKPLFGQTWFSFLGRRTVSG